MGVVNGADIEGTGQSYSLYQVMLRLRKRALEQRSVPLDEDSELIADKSSSHVVCFGTPFLSRFLLFDKRLF